jgi:hypothetical protein
MIRGSRLICDMPGCGMRYRAAAGPRDHARLRRAARQMKWTHPPFTELDFCPVCGLPAPVVPDEAEALGQEVESILSSLDPS